MWFKDLKTRLKHHHEHHHHHYHENSSSSSGGSRKEGRYAQIDESWGGGSNINNNTSKLSERRGNEQQHAEETPLITTEGALIISSSSYPGSGSAVSRKRVQKTLGYDAEYAAWLSSNRAEKTRMPPCETVLEFRQYNNAFARSSSALPPSEPRIQRVRYSSDVVSADGAVITVVRFLLVADQYQYQFQYQQQQQQQPNSSSAGTNTKTSTMTAAVAEMTSSILRNENGGQGLPSLLYIHGGGMVAGSVDIVSPSLSRLATLSGVQIFAVEYRLAPEFPAPTPVEDCYAALTWLHAHAAELGLDRARVGIMGDSAGGGLAAATALLARDRGLNPPLKSQLLVAPMLDDRAAAQLVSGASGGEKGDKGGSPLLAFATVPLQSIRMCWRAYLGPGAGQSNAIISPVSGPFRSLVLLFPARSIYGTPFSAGGSALNNFFMPL